MTDGPDFWAKEVIDSFNAHQQDRRFHPYTCGKDSSHVLGARWVDGAVWLVCPAGDGYRQSVPETYLHWKGL